MDNQDESYQMAQVGCDYNHIYFGINGIYNGGNGKGGCVLNGDGTERVLKNVISVIPIFSTKITTNNTVDNHGGFVAFTDDGTTKNMVIWGNTKMSKNNMPSTALSYIDLSTNFINSNFSENIVDLVGVNSTDNIWFQYKYKNPDIYNYGNSKIIKLTVSNGKFIFNNDTSGYTFEIGKTYIFDTSDSSNTNYQLKVSSSNNTYDSGTTVQFLTPGQKNSFIRFIKIHKYTYFYCETNGLSMGSHYNSVNEPDELTALTTLFGGNTEKDLLEKYINIPNKNIPDASLNTIIIDSPEKRRAVIEALFTVSVAPFYKTNYSSFGLNFSINNPIKYMTSMKFINSKTSNRIGVSGEKLNYFATSFNINDINSKESLFFYMGDLSDNILLSLGGDGTGFVEILHNSITDIIKTDTIQFLFTRITDKNSAARYDISFNSAYKTIQFSSSSTFDISTNTGYFVENDTFEIDGVEITCAKNGVITAGTSKTYNTIITTVNSNNKFVFNNNEELQLNFENDKNYKFDVSDASNFGYILDFSNTNSTTSYNTTRFGTPGTAGAFVTFTPGNYNLGYVFDSSVNGINMGSLYNPITMNNGISKTHLELIEADIIDNNITIPSDFYNNLTGATDDDKSSQKRRRRHQFLRNIFANNINNDTLNTTKDNLGFSTDNYKKDTYKVFNVKKNKDASNNNYVNINLNTDSDLTNENGFYSPLEDNDYALITNSGGSLH